MLHDTNMLAEKERAFERFISQGYFNRTAHTLASMLLLPVLISKMSHHVPSSLSYPLDVPDIVCQDYAVPHMENLLPKMPGGYIGVRLTPPLNNIFPKPPKVPPPPLSQEKYYAATQICTSKPLGTMTLSNNNNMNSMKASSNHSNTNSNGSNTTASLDGRNGCITPTTPLNHHLSSYSDFDTLLMDDEVHLKEFPRDKLVIVEKLGCGMFGELHLCETKGLT